MKQDPWTTEMIGRAIRLFNNGASIAEIAAALGISKGQVSGKIHRLRRETDRITRNPNPPRETANRIFWTPERCEELRRLVADGKTDAEIGRALGKTDKQVCHRRIEMGLRKSPAAKRRAVARMVQKTVKVRLPRPQPILLPPEPVPEGGIPLVDLHPHQCAYPFGAVPNVTFCGAPVAMRASGERHVYCEGHAAACYQKRYEPDQAAAARGQRNQTGLWATAALPAPTAFHGRGHGRYYDGSR